MSTTALLTVEQFEQLPEEERARYELKDGELVKMGTANYGHERTKSEVLDCLFAYNREHRVGRVLAETAFALSTSRLCVPDASFVTNETDAQADPHRILRGAPDLAIEVVSESESATELREKIQEYLDAGTKMVWSFYPSLRMIAVYDQASVRELRGDQVLEAPEILPGFRAAVAEFFE